MPVSSTASGDQLIDTPTDAASGSGATSTMSGAKPAVFLLSGEYVL